MSIEVYLWSTQAKRLTEHYNGNLRFFLDVYLTYDSGHKPAIKVVHVEYIQSTGIDLEVYQDTEKLHCLLREFCKATKRSNGKSVEYMSYCSRKAAKVFADRYKDMMMQTGTPKSSLSSRHCPIECFSKASI